MNEFLVNEFQKLGATERDSAIASQVYLELCEVKRYWDLKYDYNTCLNNIILYAKKKPYNDFSIFLPISTSEHLSFDKLQDFLAKCKSQSIYLAMLHPDSTCIYYNIAEGLAEPVDTSAKHLRVNKQHKLDIEVKKNRELIEYAALTGIPITIPKVTSATHMEDSSIECEASTSVT
ncbi:uncharacterized protein LOC126735044 [Anthonomus grandis grandis]|uniref:uncharacterized protein LOC126735044 n=1 Tax=Anthonomus grandis grandis TaxID=2921223 RepID=UPI002165907D|nr:uncharacterized protein LOC126735044 [Anthonomus grandis grandis]